MLFPYGLLLLAGEECVDIAGTQIAVTQQARTITTLGTNTYHRLQRIIANHRALVL
jgi:hypothetical protein